MSLFFSVASHGKRQPEEDLREGPVSAGHVSRRAGSATEGSGGHQPAIRRSSQRARPAAGRAHGCAQHVKTREMINRFLSAKI